VDQFIGIPMLFLSLVSGFDALGEALAPSVPPAAYFHASEICGDSLSMWLRNVASCHVSLLTQSSLPSGHSTEANAVLDDVEVLDFLHALNGHYCSMGDVPPSG
jgi:hypothetical protein